MKNLQVTVEEGKIRGIHGWDPRVAVFRGIPYAAPPVGEVTSSFPPYSVKPRQARTKRACRTGSADGGQFPAAFSRIRSCTNSRSACMGEKIFWLARKKHAGILANFKRC